MPEISAKQIAQKLRKMGDPAIAANACRFIKTGKGEYGEGDRFIGIRVPVLRNLAKETQAIPTEECLKLLASPYHEARALALFVLVIKYRSIESERPAIYRAYMKNTTFINGWDLVDSSAEHIAGAYLFSRNRKPLYLLSQSRNIWERRISIMSTFYFIRRNDFMDTLSIAEKLLDDEEDLIHKAVGWMLREVGNRDRETEEGFLLQHYKQMPRMMLRYAIEKFPEVTRLAYLRGEK